MATYSITAVVTLGTIIAILALAALRIGLLAFGIGAAGSQAVDVTLAGIFGSAVFAVLVNRVAHVD